MTPAGTGHLRANRSLILSRSAVAGAAALFPLPFIDDLLAGAARAQLLRRIAAVRGVGADEDAIAALARLGDDGARRYATRYALRRSFRRLALAARALGHAGDFAATFAIATLFDHYCARHHVGPGLDAAHARVVRAAIDAAIADARRAYVWVGLRRSVEGTTQLLLAAPRALAHRLHLLGPPHAEPIEPGAAQVALPISSNPLQRGLRAVGGALGATGQGWVQQLVNAFDMRWSVKEDSTQ